MKITFLKKKKRRPTLVFQGSMIIPSEIIAFFNDQELLMKLFPMPEFWSTSKLMTRNCPTGTYGMPKSIKTLIFLTFLLFQYPLKRSGICRVFYYNCFFIYSRKKFHVQSFKSWKYSFLDILRVKSGSKFIEIPWSGQVWCTAKSPDPTPSVGE